MREIRVGEVGVRLGRQDRPRCQYIVYCKQRRVTGTSSQHSRMVWLQLVRRVVKGQMLHPSSTKHARCKEVHSATSSPNLGLILSQPMYLRFPNTSTKTVYNYSNVNLLIVLIRVFHTRKCTSVVVKSRQTSPTSGALGQIIGCWILSRIVAAKDECRFVKSTWPYNLSIVGWRKRDLMMPQSPNRLLVNVHTGNKVFNVNDSVTPIWPQSIILALA